MPGKTDRKYDKAKYISKCLASFKGIKGRWPQPYGLADTLGIGKVETKAPAPKPIAAILKHRDSKWARENGSANAKPAADELLPLDEPNPEPAQPKLAGGIDWTNAETIGKSFERIDRENGNG